MSAAPRTKAGRALLEREALNSRSFALIRPEDIRAIEAEAVFDIDHRPDDPVVHAVEVARHVREITERSAQ